MAIHRAKWVDKDDHEGHREWAHAKFDAVIAIPRTRDGRLVLTREWRPSLDGWCIQFPGGMVDEGENPVDAAARECWEETGHRVVSVEADGLQPTAVSPGVSDELMWFFRCVVEDESDGGQPCPDEPMTIHAIAPDDLRKFLADAHSRGEHVCCWVTLACLSA